MKKTTAEITPIGQLPLDDMKKFITWAYLMRQKTEFYDMSVMTHPRLCMAKASMDGEPALFIPLRPVLMFDILTPDPKLTDRQRAICMWRIGELLEDKIMPDSGMYDAFFYTNDEQEVITCSRHGWTEIKGVHLMRKRIKGTSEPISEG
jgi:hypothetical protein